MSGFLPVMLAVGCSTLGWPDWLKAAQTRDAQVEFPDGRGGPLTTWDKPIVWKAGTWESGTWKGRTWKDGTWENGTWGGGTWENGTWKGGTWMGGIWEEGGINLASYWKDGTWENGTWKGGRWEGGTWEGGKVCDGDVCVSGPPK